jgi:hypothetical protein
VPLDPECLQHTDME